MHFSIATLLLIQNCISFSRNQLKCESPVVGHDSDSRTQRNQTSVSLTSTPGQFSPVSSRRVEPEETKVDGNHFNRPVASEDAQMGENDRGEELTVDADGYQIIGRQQTMVSVQTLRQTKSPRLYECADKVEHSVGSLAGCRKTQWATSRQSSLMETYEVVDDELEELTVVKREAQELTLGELVVQSLHRLIWLSRKDATISASSASSSSTMSATAIATLRGHFDQSKIDVWTVSIH
ncbi:unnamed protein product [Protopolystoma xenopodis]|uniref:Uncharacterized protein n=1 Tax=Protopolystoma xenopodis TaxID=117903 RepID=A0A3S5AW71_9PLAT|nr:unnamed protein product [Protopolystoma xenopodis]